MFKVMLFSVCMVSFFFMHSSVNAGEKNARDNVIGEKLRLHDVGYKYDVPFAIGFDSNGGTYVLEFDGGKLTRYFKDEKAKVIAGTGAKGYSGDGGNGIKAKLNGPHNIAVTSTGDVYIADTWNNVVRKVVAKTGFIETVAGTGKKGFSGDGADAKKALFSGVFCVSLNSTQDKLCITDLGNRRIRVVDLKTNLVTTVAGNGKKGVPQDGSVARKSPLFDPRAAVMDSKGNVYVLERGGHALRVVKVDGTIVTLVGNGKKGKADGEGINARLNGPKHLCLDLAENVIIADAENHLIRKYNVKTRQVTTLPIKGLKRPHGVCLHADGRLFIADSYNHRILSYKN